MSDSIMDGIEFKDKRKTVDADWSKAKRTAIGSAIAIIAITAIGAGSFFAWENRPVRLPRSADEAIAVINSGRIENLNEDRQRQYFAETSRLMQDIPEDDRRDYFRDEKNRDAMRQVMMEQMDNSMREIARGNVTMDEFRQQMMERFQNRSPRGERGEGERGERPERAEGERPDANDRRERMVGRVQGQFQNGDGQSMGLMMAFRQQMGGGMGRPGGGGGNRNGGN